LVGTEFGSCSHGFIFRKYFELWATNLVQIFEKFLQIFVDFSKFANLFEGRGRRAKLIVVEVIVVDRRKVVVLRIKRTNTAEQQPSSMMTTVDRRRLT
jgi:hypothetical protein